MKTNYKSFSNNYPAASVSDASIFASTEVEENEIIEEPEVVEEEITEPEVIEEQKTSEDLMGKTTCKVYLRPTPGTDKDPITDLSKGEELLISSDENADWYQVFTASGQEGYVMKQFVELI